MSDTIVTKLCCKCKQIKPTSEFHKQKSTKTGFQYYCIACKANVSKEYYSIGNGKNRLKQYRQTIVYKKNRKRQIERYRQAHTERRNASVAVMNAIHAKKLLPVNTYTCFRCHKQAEHYHHFSYLEENWLRVIPFCQPCHTMLHIAIQFPKK